MECGGSTPLCYYFSALCQGGVEPPHSKVLRTAIFMRAPVGNHEGCPYKWVRCSRLSHVVRALHIFPRYDSPRAGSFDLLNINAQLCGKVSHHR